jgi:hypothetical protein
MNLKPSTQERIQRVLGCVADTSDWEYLRKTVETVLREQDRDTRHACAEAVAATRRDGRMIECERLVLRDAEAACINAQSI